MDFAAFSSAEERQTLAGSSRSPHRGSATEIARRRNWAPDVIIAQSAPSVEPSFEDGLHASSVVAAAIESGGSRRWTPVAIAKTNAP